MRDDRERLEDILEAIAKIEKYAAKGKEAFDNEELIQIWIVYHVQLIGEATARLSPGIREQFPDTPWTDIVSMRNVLVHQYFGIDMQQIWDTVTIDLPKLKNEINILLEKIDSSIS